MLVLYALILVLEALRLVLHALMLVFDVLRLVLETLILVLDVLMLVLERVRLVFLDSNKILQGIISLHLRKCCVSVTCVY